MIRKRFLIWFLVFSIPIGIWVFIVSKSGIVQAEMALARRDYATALALAIQQLRRSPTSDRALLVAGLACHAKLDFAGTHRFLSHVSNSQTAVSGIAKGKLAHLATMAGHWKEAEELFRQSMSLTRQDPEIVNSFIYLLTLEGRSWESLQLAIQQLKSGVVTSNYLVLVASVRPALESDEAMANACLASFPNDPLPRLILARKYLRDNKQEDAKSQLKLVLEKYPDLLEAHALLLRIIVETDAADELQEASTSLPATADSHPEVWVARGTWAENHGELEAAARCLWEALKLNPNHPEANYRLSQILLKLNQQELAMQFGLRSESLTKLSREMEPLVKTNDFEKLPWLINQLEALGRDSEAVGWCQIIYREKGVLPDGVLRTLNRIYPRLLMAGDSNFLGGKHLQSIDFSHYPLPTLKVILPKDVTPANFEKPSSSISFHDDADQVGLRFIYQNGASNDEWESLLEMDGGGIAVLDYDNDCWPDLYLTQGGRLPPATFDSSINDRLFRNRQKFGSLGRQREYEDVTEQARLKDLGYGQGVTAGDFNNDGFQDFYVANIGQNQFFRNNGDGTFTEITSAVKQPEVWSSSCVIADLNQDTLPDLYVVTYLAGKEPFAACRKKAASRCAPSQFAGETDRFYLNLGDGTFRDLTNDCGLQATDGRGLGVVVADFDATGRLSLYVANDIGPNFYFHNLTESKDVPRFEEQGLVSGLALDQMGRTKSSMGIAAGDYNRDGLLDMFVTNFYRESNDLYCQQSDRSFRDVSRDAHLYDASFLKLGWGTQFIDADLDGAPDLVVANGHVHEPDEKGVPYEMEPQFFRNQGDSTFIELPGVQLGDYFQKKWHGRPMVRLDWNRDGLEDICISHLNQPVALLTNQTVNHGHFLALRLVAVDSARDAIGARIKVTIGNQSWETQLTAGDGYQASNERRIVLGLGDHAISDSVEVLWPSGSRQEFTLVENDREWILIEHLRLLELKELN